MARIFWLKGGGSRPECSAPKAYVEVSRPRDDKKDCNEQRRPGAVVGMQIGREGGQTIRIAEMIETGDFYEADGAVIYGRKGLIRRGHEGKHPCST